MTPRRAALGIEVRDVSAGAATATMTVRADMVNGHGITHGAFVFAVADTAFACACNSHGPLTVAAAADITFVAPSYAATCSKRAPWSAPGSGAPESTTSPCAAATTSSPSSAEPAAPSRGIRRVSRLGAAPRRRECSTRGNA